MELMESIIKDSILVIKGKQDIIAIKNSFTLVLNRSGPTMDNNYDIETFNGFSKNMFDSSQLEETYKNIIKYDSYHQTNAKAIFDEIKKDIGDKAHNPVVDSLFTIVVAVVINIGLNEFFSKKRMIGGTNDRFKYIIYKSKTV